jgi:hypothetical protein
MGMVSQGRFSLIKKLPTISELENTYSKAENIFSKLEMIHFQGGNRNRPGSPRPP